MKDLINFDNGLAVEGLCETRKRRTEKKRTSTRLRALAKKVSSKKLIGELSSKLSSSIEGRRSSYSSSRSQKKEKEFTDRFCVFVPWWLSS